MPRSGKPDFKEFNPSSPISPLISRRTNSWSSSDSAPGRNGDTHSHKRSDNHSGDISVCSETSPIALDTARSVSSPSHPKTKSCSASTPLIYSGKTSRASPIVNVLPTGNIVPSGKILTTATKTVLGNHSLPKKQVLNSGNTNYGHGSIVNGFGGGRRERGGEGGGGGIQNGEDMVKKALVSWDFEFVKNIGNDQYKSKNFSVALSLYNRAISISPANAVCRCNRAAAFISLGRIPEAVRDCEEAIRLDPTHQRAHERLGSLYLRLGQVENARQHLFFPGKKPNSEELLKLEQVEKLLKRCSEARLLGDWETVLRKGNDAIAAGAESSPQFFSCIAEAHLKLHQFVEADSGLSNIPDFEPHRPSCSIFGMLSEAYVLYVRAQVDMALGWFQNAVTEAESAWKVDCSSYEIAKMRSNALLVKRAHDRGNDLFNDGHFQQAASAYGEGLKHDPNNSILYYDKARCWYELGLWENSIHECDRALKIQPSYTKALLRRAQSYEKLGFWADSVRDYELLRKGNPGNIEVAEALCRAQDALRKSRGKEVENFKLCGRIEEVSDLDRFRAAISSSGNSIVFFKEEVNYECEQISPTMDNLSIEYPSLCFLKVDVEESLGIAKVENVTVVPTVRIYTKGRTVVEMICPTQQLLESSLKQRASSLKPS